jgi:hypothetical protein
LPRSNGSTAEARIHCVLPLPLDVGTIAVIARPLKTEFPLSLKLAPPSIDL